MRGGLRLLENFLKVGGRAGAAGIGFGVFDPPDHIHVDHGHGFVERLGGILDPSSRSKQPELFASKRSEQESARKLALKGRKNASQLEHSGCSGGIVIGSRMDFADLRRSHGIKIAAAEMIIVSA